MLWQLYIENVAIIEKLNVEFSAGFVVFTGETGAGKSILIDAIGAVLGERVSKDLVRHGAAKAVVTASFTDLTEAAVQKLEEIGYPCEEGTVMLTREVSADGRSSCRIDGRPATVALVRQIAPLLLQIHGQHDTHMLLSDDAHSEIIDRYGGLNAQAAQYRSSYRMLLAMRRELEELSMNEAERARMIDLYQYQIDEIEQAQLQVGEEEELAERRQIARNSAKITDALSGSYAYLNGDDETPGALELLSEAASSLRAVARYAEELSSISDQLDEAFYAVDDAAHTLRDITDSYTCDPDELNEIEERLDLIHRLSRKYGNTIEEILAFQTETQKQLDALSDSDSRRESLDFEIEQQQALCEQAAAALHEARAAAAERFSALVMENLRFLDMPNVRFTVRLDPVSLGENGVDHIAFYISTNPGEEPKPIAKIASGGELSRIMLSIKNVQADSDDVGTLIFDEIDTGVSGRAAQKIGRMLTATAGERQVICVTHLAQIAALAAEHLYLYKTVEGDRTFTRVRVLDTEGRVEELSRIMGGEQITELVRQNAAEMLRLAGSK